MKICINFTCQKIESKARKKGVFPNFLSTLFPHQSTSPVETQPTINPHKELVPQISISNLNNPPIHKHDSIKRRLGANYNRNLSRIKVEH